MRKRCKICEDILTIDYSEICYICFELCSDTELSNEINQLEDKRSIATSNIRDTSDFYDGRRILFEDDDDTGEQIILDYIFRQDNEEQFSNLDDWELVWG